MVGDNSILFTLNLDNGPFKSAAAAAESALGPLKAALAAVAGAFAFGKVIEAANDADRAINHAAISMKLAGDYSREAFDKVKGFASALQDTTGVGDDTTIKMLGLAQSFGLTIDQAKKVAGAAIDMSSALGTDLETAVRDLSSTYNDHLGRLGRLDTGLNSLTKNQLAAGAAVDILAAKYRGTATALRDTFGGALDAARTRFVDLLESIGNLIVQNPAFVKALHFIEQGFKDLASTIDKNAGTIKTFLNTTLVGFVEALAKAAAGLVGVVEVAKILTGTALLIAKGLAALVAALTGIESVKAAVDGLAYGLIQILDVMEKLAAKENGSLVLKIFGTDGEELSQRLGDAKDQLNDILTTTGAGEATSTYFTELAKQIDDVTKGADGMFDGAEKALKDMAGYLRGTVLPGLKAAGTQMPDVTNTINVVGKKAPGDFGESGVGRSTIGEIVSAFGQRMGEAGSDIAKRFAENILDGADGARKFLSSALGDAASGITTGLSQLFDGPLAESLAAAAGPIGAGAAALFDALSKGPDFVRDMVNQFADALPALIDNIVKAIPVFVKTLADRAPDIIVALVNGAPRISVAIAVALSNPLLYVDMAKALGQALLDSFNEKLGQLDFTDFNAKMSAAATGFTDQLEEVLGPPLGGIKDAFDSFGDRIREAAQDFVDTISGKKSGTAITQAGKNADKAGRAIADIATVGGAEVYYQSRRSAFSGGPPSGTTDPILVEILNHLRKPTEVTTSIDVDGQSLANVMLRLSRQNSRTTT